MEINGNHGFEPSIFQWICSSKSSRWSFGWKAPLRSAPQNDADPWVKNNSLLWTNHHSEIGRNRSIQLNGRFQLLYLEGRVCECYLCPRVRDEPNTKAAQEPRGSAWWSLSVGGNAVHETWWRQRMATLLGIRKWIEGWWFWLFLTLQIWESHPKGHVWDRRLMQQWVRIEMSSVAESTNGLSASCKSLKLAGPAAMLQMTVMSSNSASKIWLVVWLPFGLFSHILGCDYHPNWRTPIFQRGGPTTKQKMNPSVATLKPFVDLMSQVRTVEPADLMLI